MDISKMSYNQWIYNKKKASRTIPYLKSYDGKFFKLIVLKSDFDYSTRRMSEKGVVNEQKLENNIIRAKSRIFELCVCNDWDWFITLTLDKNKYDRYNLKAYIKDLSQFLRNQSRIKGIDYKYILVPEQHQDGAWHIHGMLKGICERDMTRFKQGDNVPQKLIDGGFYNWLPYAKKFGFVSLMPLYDGDDGLIKLSSYMRKYMTKSLMETKMELGLHSFYASQGLKGADDLKGVVSPNFEEFMNFDFKYESDFVDVYNISVEQANELMRRTNELIENGMEGAV